MPVAHLAAIHLECTEPLTLARFWAGMLDGETAVETPGFCAVKAGPILLGAIRVDDHRPTTWPSNERSQQLHLDLGGEDPLISARRIKRRFATFREQGRPTGRPSWWFPPHPYGGWRGQGRAGDRAARPGLARQRQVQSVVDGKAGSPGQLPVAARAVLTTSTV